MGIVHWVKDNGKTYCVGPEEEKHEDGVLVTPQPTPYHQYDMQAGEWVHDGALYEDMVKPKAIQEIKEAYEMKQLISDPQEIIEVDAYIAAIKACMANREGNFPAKPSALSDQSWLS